ncbi:MAG: copper amine oxidase N-terminal domain-containing protein [Dethiobacteria bacterium]|jgi:hypothetical protein
MSGSPRKKVLWLQFLALFMVLVMVLPLAGCLDNHAALKQGFMQNMEVKSCRASGNFSVINNNPAAQLNPQVQALFSMLEKGLALEAALKSTTSMKMVLTPADAAACKLLGWEYPQAPALSFYVDGGKIALKTSADARYLVIDPAETGRAVPEADVDFSAVFGTDYVQGQTERAYAFAKALIKDFNFPLSRVESLGTETLQFPDGTIIARKIRVDLDFEEILALLSYTAEYLSESEAFKDYVLFSVREPLEKMVEEGVLPPEEMPSPEEIEALAETNYQQLQSSLSEALAYLRGVSPALLKKQFGLDLSATEEYYLDQAGFIRKTKGTYQLKAEHEMLASILGTPQLDLTVNAEQILWDINKPVEVAFPTAAEQVSFFSLMADPDLQAEFGEGPLSLFVNLLASMDDAAVPANPANLVIDPENNQCLLNGQAIDLDPAPYKEGETLMVPFRALAELAGGEIQWMPENKQACYRDERVEIKVASGSRKASVNGAEKDLPTTAKVKDGRLMIPAWLAGEMAQYFAAEENSIVFIF